jgi:hypothetical protein
VTTRDERSITRFSWRAIQAAVRTLGVALLVLGTAVCALLLVDRVNQPPRPTDPGIASIDRSRAPSRLLILHMDSWRDSSARDSTLFPTVARLRREGASGTLLGVYEGFTIPAVRAAFTGHAETQLVNVVRNFRFRELPIESFFRDVHELGRRTLVVAREPFTQFGPVFTERFPAQDGVDMYALDRLRPGIALRAYRSEPFDVIVCHWESFDWVAHEGGIGTARYRAAALEADSVIAQFAAARAPNDYLLVYGDHGHTATGEHKTGFDIPTFWLMVGPDVTPGVELPPLPITNLRYLASHAQGITLRGAPYDLDLLKRVIPVSSTRGSVARRDATSTAKASRAASDYLLALVMLAIAIGVAAMCWRWLPSASDDRGDRIAAVVIIAALFAIGLLRPWTAEALRPRFALVAPLYALGVVAKLTLLLLMLRGTGRAQWFVAVAMTVVLTLVELRVVEQPWLIGVLALFAAPAAIRARNEGHRRAALIALLQLLVYFTLRAPLYLFPWIDVFLLIAALLGTSERAARHPAIRDAILASGAWTLSCGALAGNLEWGFLYSLFPAHLVELQVQWFVPFILAKIPLLLLLTLVVARRRADRTLGLVVMSMAALRFGAVWIARLGGAPTAEIWPVAEQGAYLAIFVVAVVAWGWQIRGRRATKFDLSTFAYSS